MCWPRWCTGSPRRNHQASTIRAYNPAPDRWTAYSPGQPVARHLGRWPGKTCDAACGAAHYADEQVRVAARRMTCAGAFLARILVLAPIEQPGLWAKASLNQAAPRAKPRPIRSATRRSKTGSGSSMTRSLGPATPRWTHPPAAAGRRPQAHDSPTHNDAESEQSARRSLPTTWPTRNPDGPRLVESVGRPLIRPDQRWRQQTFDVGIADGHGSREGAKALRPRCAPRTRGILTPTRWGIR